MATVRWIWTIFFLLQIVGVVSAMNTPYSLSGHIYNIIDNEPIVGASISFTNLNTSEIIYAISTTNGEYQQDAANFPSGYNNTDIIEYYTTYNDATNTTNVTIDTDYGGIIKDIYLNVPTNQLIDPITWANDFITPSWSFVLILVIVFVSTLVIGAIVGHSIGAFDVVNAMSSIIIITITLYIGLMIMNSIG